MREEFVAALRAGCGQAQIALPERVEGLAADHFELLGCWNRRMNLTRFESVQEAALFHYAESLVLAAEVPSWAGSLVDIGSGAGFPGLVVAWARPEIAVILVESHQRKAVFLKEAARSVENVQIIASRMEEVEGVFDIAVSRAVARSEIVADVLRLSRGFLMLASCEERAGWESDLGYVEVRQLPWGKNRCLVKGCLEVPRGTSQ